MGWLRELLGHVAQVGLVTFGLVAFGVLVGLYFWWFGR